MAIDNLSRCGNKECAVRIPIERHSQRGFLSWHALLQLFKVHRTARGIDISAVRIASNRQHVATERPKQLWRQLVSRAVRAVQDDTQTCQICAIQHSSSQEIQ